MQKHLTFYVLCCIIIIVRKVIILGFMEADSMMDKRNDTNYFYGDDKETVTVNAGFLNYLLDRTFSYFCHDRNGSCDNCPISNYFPNRNCTELTYAELVQFFENDIK